MKKQDLILLISIKSTLFLLFFLLYQANSDLYDVDVFFVFVSDSTVYFPPIEEYLDTGIFDLVRMPGVFPIYAPIYATFGASIARNFLVLFQFVLSIWSIWMFSKIVYEKLGREITITFIIISAISIPLLDVVFLGIMDSLSISFLLLSIYFFFKWGKTKILNDIFWSGFFISWAFFLREIAIVPYFILGVIILLEQGGLLLKIKWLFAFYIVLAIAGTIWVATNYHHKKEIVLTRTYSFSEEFRAMVSLPKAFGGRFPKWYEGGWFFDRENGCETNNFPFSERVFTEDYGLNDLIALKTEYCNLNFEDDNRAFLEKIENIKSSYKTHHWFDYYFVNYFRHLRDYLFEPTVFITLPLKAWNKSSALGKAIKVYFILNYNTIAILGFIGLIILWFKKKGIRRLLLVSISPLVFLVLTHRVELRYFYPMIPIFTLGLSMIIVILLKSIKSKVWST